MEVNIFIRKKGDKIKFIIKVTAKGAHSVNDVSSRYRSFADKTNKRASFQKIAPIRSHRLRECSI